MGWDVIIIWLAASFVLIRKEKTCSAGRIRQLKIVLKQPHQQVKFIHSHSARTHARTHAHTHAHTHTRTLLLLWNHCEKGFSCCLLYECVRNIIMCAAEMVLSVFFPQNDRLHASLLCIQRLPTSKRAKEEVSTLAFVQIILWLFENQQQGSYDCLLQEINVVLLKQMTPV